jgi:hypothetical protein
MLVGCVRCQKISWFIFCCKHGQIMKLHTWHKSSLNYSGYGTWQNFQRSWDAKVLDAAWGWHDWYVYCLYAFQLLIFVTSSDDCIFIKTFVHASMFWIRKTRTTRKWSRMAYPLSLPLKKCQRANIMVLIPRYWWHLYILACNNCKLQLFVDYLLTSCYL